MEQVRTGKFFIKILLAIVVVMGVIFAIGWGVLYSSFLANSEQIILLRNNYLTKLSTLVAPGKLLYSIRSTAVKREGGEITYVYQLTGRVVEVDYKEWILTIQDMRGVVWQCQLSISPVLNKRGMPTLSISQKTIQADGQVINGLVTIEMDPLAPETAKGLVVGDTVVVRWQDKRKAHEIEGTIELKSDKVVPIMKVMVEGAQ